MKPLIFHEIFHGVGQGLFYSGIVRCDNKQLSFVYDCGSTSSKRLLEFAIERFSFSLIKSKLDLLAISHFHADHVNGLELLLKDIEVDTVVIPYFPPILRLYYALANRGQERWYYEFLTDPVSYFFERRAKKIILIFGNGPSGEEGGIPDFNLPEGPIEGNGSDTDNIPNINLPDSKEPFIDSKDQELWRHYINNKMLFFKDTNGYISYNFCGLNWIFAFYNYPVNINALQNFYQCIKNNLNNCKIEDLIKDKNKRKSILECYKRISKNLKNDINNTSLMLYHGPYNKDLLCTIFCFDSRYYYRRCLLKIPELSLPHCWYYCKKYLCDLREDFYEEEFVEHLMTRYCHKRNTFATLLTGDIDLNNNLADIVKHFLKYTQNVLTFQVPHHGTKANWNNGTLQNFNNSLFYPISFGLFNRYGHPHPTVKNDILKSYKIPILVSECSSFENHFKMEFLG